MLLVFHSGKMPEGVLEQWLICLEGSHKGLNGVLFKCMYAPIFSQYTYEDVVGARPFEL